MPAPYDDGVGRLRHLMQVVSGMIWVFPKDLKLVSLSLSHLFLVYGSLLILLNLKAVKSAKYNFQVAIDKPTRSESTLKRLYGQPNRGKENGEFRLYKKKEENPIKYQWVKPCSRSLNLSVQPTDNNTDYKVQCQTSTMDWRLPSYKSTTRPTLPPN